MAKVCIAIIAILVLALSAGFTITPAQTARVSPTRQVVQSRRNALLAGEGELSLLGIRTQAASAVQAVAPEEGPAPVLLAYLGLVILGSIVAIGSVRATQGRDM